MTIEMDGPESVLPRELWNMAKGIEPLPKVQEAKAILKAKLKNNEPISSEDIKKVNRLERMDFMKQKTDELSSRICHEADPNDPEIHSMSDTYDYLAIDWVYGDELLWDGSRVDVYLKQIYAYLTKSRETITRKEK